jgi:hypothetical protein
LKQSEAKAKTVGGYEDEEGVVECGVVGKYNNKAGWR